MKYLILGAGGQLGRDLASRLTGDIVGVGRERADVTDAASLRRTLDEVKPDVVLNCAAYNFVDRAETEPSAAFAVNAIGVGTLARLCGERDCTLVQFSSDYVFGADRERTSPYSESDLPGPLSVYGVSKLAGEYLAQAYCPRHFVIRTCGLYGVWGVGGKGGNFVETMLKLGSQPKPVRVVTDEVCTPTFTADLADATSMILTLGQPGLYHVTNSGQCSRFEFASTIFRLAGIRPQLEPITSAQFGAAARRPSYAVLANSAMERLALPPLRHWSEALAAYLIERQSRK
jgi:dTDP-4-dehydrorhamnose reductase